ncbi:MAG: Hsp20/alpha crystallin family protein [Sumerlaeia bacterium]
MATTFDPFRELEVLRREMERVFNGAASTPAANRLRNAFLPGRSARTYPLVNMAENEDGYIVEALAPGIDPEKLEVSVLGNTLTISGEKGGVLSDVPAEKVHRAERAAARFTRTIKLPVAIADEGTSAKYENGVLRLELPKAEASKPRKVLVHAA